MPSMTCINGIVMKDRTRKLVVPDPTDPRLTEKVDGIDLFSPCHEPPPEAHVLCIPLPDLYTNGSIKRKSGFSGQLDPLNFVFHFARSLLIKYRVILRVSTAFSIKIIP